MPSGKLRTEYETVVIGGGFYGCALANALAESRQQVVVLEAESEVISRASYVNQARVHNGYHYPRSYLTALRSAANFPRFVEEFRDCIDDTFEHAYAIAKNNSKVSGYQFRKFCQSIGAPLGRTSERLRKLLNPALIEDTFSVTEYAFNAVAMRRNLRTRLQTAGVELLCGMTADRVSPLGGGRLAVHLMNGAVMYAGRVFNCTYAGINELLRRSRLDPLPLKFELAEVAMISAPDPLAKAGITVIDGPFFSTMPFPARRLHSLTHVRYTPHFSWGGAEPDTETTKSAPQTKFPYMLKDAQRYLPSLHNAKYQGSLFEVKVKLAQNEVDDGRPILFRKDYGLENLSIVLGAKIDNIYDALAAVREAGLVEGLAYGAHV